MSMSQFVEVTQSPVVEFGHWRMIWNYSSDRWQHRIQIRPQTPSSKDWQDLLASADSTPEIGPVFQDLLLEQRADGIVEYQAMGQSGGAIHSASIRCQPETDDAIFDLATRFRAAEQLQPLIATYRLQTDSPPPRLPRIESLFPTTEGTAVHRIPMDSSRNWQIRWSPAGDVEGGIRRSGTGLTVCWGYRISWAEGVSS